MRFAVTRIVRSRQLVAAVLVCALFSLAFLWTYTDLIPTMMQTKKTYLASSLQSPPNQRLLDVVHSGEDTEPAGAVEMKLNIQPPATQGEINAIRECVRNFPKFREYALGPLIPFMNDIRFKGLSFLNKDSSTVVEVGGYTGVDAEQILSLYKPIYHVLEPVPEYFQKLQAKYGNKPHVTLYDFGLGRETKNITIHTSVDGTSAFGKNGQGSEVVLQIRSARDFLTSLGLPEKPLDMLQLNCEGCEYELLEVLLETGLLRAVRHVTVQFHLKLPGLERLEERYCAIQTLLLRTHQPIWQFRFTWQQWQLSL